MQCPQFRAQQRVLCSCAQAQHVRAQDASAQDMTAQRPVDLSALISGRVPEFWVREFIAHLDPNTLAAVLRSTKDGRKWLLQAADRATLTLRAHGVLSAAVWQGRLREAERGLALRGEPPRTTLVLRLVTQNAAAVQAVLGMTATARRAITGFELCQATRSRVPWLHELPHSFPNLTTLHLEYTYDPLPPPDQLPLMKRLSVVVSISLGEHVSKPSAAEVAAGAVEQLCGSIGAYTTRITHLSIMDTDSDGRTKLPWDLIFPTPTTKLHTFHTDSFLGNTLLHRLRANAPDLQHLSCMAPLPYKPRWDADGELVSDNDRLTDEHAQASWAVQDLQCMRRQVTAADLALLPRSAHGLCIATTSERPLSVLIHVADAQVRQACVACPRSSEKQFSSCPL